MGPITISVPVIVGTDPIVDADLDDVRRLLVILAVREALRARGVALPPIDESAAAEGVAA